MQIGDSYRPNDDEDYVARALAIRREKLNSGDRGGWQGAAPESAELRLRQDVGANLSEIAVSRLTNLCWTGLAKGADGCADVGDRYEVRSILEPEKGLLIRPKDIPAGRPFLLVYVEPSRHCHVLGWAYPQDAADNGRALQDGDPAWVLPQRLLNETWPPESEPLIAKPSRASVDWLCRDCVERGERPIQVALRDGLCGSCWLRRWKRTA